MDKEKSYNYFLSNGLRHLYDAEWKCLNCISMTQVMDSRDERDVQKIEEQICYIKKALESLQLAIDAYKMAREQLVNKENS